MEERRPLKPPRNLPQKMRRACFIYLLVPYLSVSIIFTIFQRRMMYQPTVSSDLSVAALGLDSQLLQDVQIQTDDGSTLKGWLLGRTDLTEKEHSETPLVLYFPGNSLNRYDRMNDLKEMTARGFDVLIFDYRGFGDSTGSPTESALSSDAQLIWQYACDTLAYDQQNIVVFGESLGGAVALSLWADDASLAPRPAALILNSTFASMPQTVGWHYPLFPFRLLLLDR